MLEMFLLKYDAFSCLHYLTYSMLASLYCEKKIEEGKGEQYRML